VISSGCEGEAVIEPARSRVSRLRVHTLLGLLVLVVLAGLSVLVGARVASAGSGCSRSSLG
jgi:hypothetical protein